MPSMPDSNTNTNLIGPLQSALLKQRRWLMMAMLMVGACVIVIIWGMCHYRIPGKLWRNVDAMSEPIPEITIAKAYRVQPGAPRLSFGQHVESGGTLEEWRFRASEKLKELLGIDWPVAIPTVRSIDEQLEEGVVRETLVFTQSDGQEVPAFLLRPVGAHQRATLVVIPGHSRGIVATAGIVADAQHGNAWAFAKKGYVVLTMEVRGFGYLGMMGESPEGVDFMSHAAYSLHAGKTALGRSVEDVIAGVNYLSTRSEVDIDKLGLVGFSSGGKTAIYLAALDLRIRAVVASGCVMSNEANFRLSRHDSYEVLPGMSSWLELSDCMGLVAPRAMLVHWGELDNEPWKRCAAYNESSLTEFETARQIYSAQGAGMLLEKVVTPRMGHEFDNASALEFLMRRLPLNSE